MRRLLIAGAALALAGCASTNPAMTAAQTFEVSWTGLDAASKAVKTAVQTGVVTPGSATGQRLAMDLRQATEVLEQADNARLLAGNGANPVVDTAAAASALADISAVLFPQPPKPGA